MISPLAWRLLAWCVLSLIALAGPRAEAPQGPTGSALADLLAKFDTYAESSRQRLG
jgi:hypothetical protein